MQLVDPLTRLPEELYGNEDGSIPATFQLLYFIGWKPHPSQASNRQDSIYLFEMFCSCTLFSPSPTHIILPTHRPSPPDVGQLGHPWGILGTCPLLTPRKRTLKKRPFLLCVAFYMCIQKGCDVATATWCYSVSVWISIVVHLYAGICHLH